MKANDSDRQTFWIVTELYYPEMTSTGYYLTKIAEGLAEDFKVGVLCGQPNYSARGTRAPRRELHKNVEIYRSFGTTLDKNVILFRLVNMLTLSISIFFLALFKFRRNEDVMVVTTPPSLPFITAAAALIRGAKYTLLIHDNYPEILIAAGKTEPDSFLVKILNYANAWLYRRARKIIVVGRDMKELLEAKLEKAGIDGKIPVVTIPNWAELEQVEPATRTGNPLLEELGISDKFVFLYAGNMGYPNDVESFVFCAEKLRKDERFHFIFLGAGVKRKWLETEISEKKLENISLLTPKPRSEQKIFLNACDVALVSLVRQMWGVSMPSRTYNILAAGKPILALTEEKSEIARVIEDDQIGWSAPPNNENKLLEIIYEVYNNRENLEEMGRRARRAALEKYSLETALNKYRRTFSDNASDNV